MTKPKRKKYLKLYWLWKLKHRKLKDLVEQEQIHPNELYTAFHRFDEEFKMVGWSPKV